MQTLPQNPDQRVLTYLTGLAGHHGRNYCWPSQNTIRRGLAARTGRSMSPRTLNRHLAALTRDGWVKRIRRHRRGKTGTLELHSTLYTFTRRTLAWLAAAARTAGRFLGQRAQVLDSFAVPSLAQYENPNTQSLSLGGQNRPPPGWKDVVERLRRTNKKAKPL